MDPADQLPETITDSRGLAHHVERAYRLISQLVERDSWTSRPHSLGLFLLGAAKHRRRVRSVAE